MTTNEEIIETLQTSDQVKAFILARLAVEAKPAVWDPATQTLACPHCAFQGIVEGEGQPGKYGVGFRYLEDIVNVRVASSTDDGTLAIESYYESADGYDDGDNGRLECRHCLGECALPAGLEIDFR